MLYITVTDADDQNPVFSNDTYFITLPEYVSVQSLIYIIYLISLPEHM